MRKITAHPLVLTGIVLFLAVILSIAVGSVFISPTILGGIVKARLTGQLLPPEWLPFDKIVFSLRLPRTALMILSGAGLAGSGTAFQGMFRNPLADPYLIGVASGAGLGAIAAMSFGWAQSPLGIYAIPLAAFLAGLITVWVVYQLGRVNKSLPTTNLILAGVAVSSFTSSVTSLIMLRGNDEIRRALVWLLGGAALSGWQPVLAMLPYTLIGLTALFFMGHTLNVLQFGDEQARQLGIPTETVRRVVLIAATLTTATAIAFAGIIGFVGLIVPHILRFVWGSDYRRLLPLSAIGGAAFLLIADVIARVAAAPQELPVGIITALTGAPFFLWVMRRSHRQYLW